MARTREFDEELALERAMRLFWERGYESASLSDLLEAMQLSRSSFYDAFGTKRALLLATLARYVDSGMCGLAEPLFRDNASRPEIEAFVGNMIAHSLCEEGQRGCFVNNCMAELAPHDEEVLAAVRLARRGLERRLVQVIKRGQRDGSIGSQESAQALARFIGSSVSGLNLIAKTRPGRAVLADVARVTLNALNPTSIST